VPDWGLASDAVLAQAARENFPVALRWLPARWRSDLLALYGFARLADDLGDEVAGDRLARLDALEEDLERAFRGEAREPLLRRLEPTLRARSLPREPFLRLIEANRVDQRVHRYASFEELRGYCALSADPVGHLVLHVFGAASPDNLALSDAICTALQLVEHLQDVAEDRARGRVYLPAEDLARFGCPEAELGRAPASPALRRVVAFEARRARALLREGEPLLARLGPVARLAVAGFAAGGHAALDALERGGFDVTSRLLQPRRRDLVRRTLELLWRSRGGRSRS
jgi:squalene synthase HpnC